MAIRPSAPQTIGQVLDSSFRIFRISWGKVWLLALVGAIFSGAADVYEVLSAGTGVSKNALAGLKFGCLVVYFGFSAAIYLRQHALASAGALGGDEVAVAFKRLPWLILMVLAMFLALIVSFAPVGGFFAVAQSQSLSLAAIILGACVLFLIPLYVIVNLSLSFILVMIEKRGPVESMRASQRLVSGNWWRTLLILSIGGVILTVAYFLAIAAVIGMAPLLSQHEATVTVMVTLVLLVVLIGVVVLPYFTALLLALYYDLKLRKEGGDLAARIDSLA